MSVLETIKNRQRIFFPSEDARVAERIEGDYIVGPFGIWPFPLLNALLQFVLRLRSTYTTVSPKRRRLTIYEVVRDERGRIVEIVEHEREE